MQERRLIIMRHASAGSHADRDHARPLTARGISEAKGVGRRLTSDGLIPSSVLCSTALRCRETWQAVGEPFATPIAIDFDDALYNASADALLAALKDLPDEGNETVLLLAHNPGVSLLALGLAMDDEDATASLRAGFAPASFAAFSIAGSWSALTPRSATLRRFVRTSSA